MKRPPSEQKPREASRNQYAFTRSKFLIDGFTLKEVASKINRHVSTVLAWYKNGNTTMEAIKKMNDRIDANGHKLYNTCKGRMSALDIKRINGQSSQYIFRNARTYGWGSEILFWEKLSRVEFKERVHDKGILTIKQIHRKKHGTVLKNETKPKRLFEDEEGNLFTYKQVAILLNVTYNRLLNWANEYKCVDIRDFKARKQYMEDYNHIPVQSRLRPKFVPPSQRITADFDRIRLCHKRLEDNEVCKHDADCLESRVFQHEHHKRYRDDGSCYRGIKCGEVIIGSAIDPTVGVRL